VSSTASCGDASGSAERRSRGDVLKLGALGAGALLLTRTGGAVAEAAGPSAEQDQKILNFALVLERLQAAFYSEALARASLTGELLEFAETVGEHERQHVEFLEKALGDAAGPPPRLELQAATRDAGTFGRTARMLEDAGVAAYNGQAANLTKKTLGPAAEIVSVEGRHAAWIRDILGLEPAPRAADPGAESAEIVRQLRTSGLLV
jgi:rubrerythrin